MGGERIREKVQKLERSYGRPRQRADTLARFAIPIVDG